MKAQLFTQSAGAGGAVLSRVLNGFCTCGLTPARVSELSRDPWVAMIREDSVVRIAETVEDVSACPGC
jgi:hypothetical protein